MCFRAFGGGRLDTSWYGPFRHLHLRAEAAPTEQLLANGPREKRNSTLRDRGLKVSMRRLGPRFEGVGHGIPVRGRVLGHTQVLEFERMEKAWWESTECFLEAQAKDDKSVQNMGQKTAQKSTEGQVPEGNLRSA